MRWVVSLVHLELGSNRVQVELQRAFLGVCGRRGKLRNDGGGQYRHDDHDDQYLYQRESLVATTILHDKVFPFAVNVLLTGSLRFWTAGRTK